MTAYNRPVQPPNGIKQSADARTPLQLFVARIPHRKIAGLGKLLGLVLYNVDLRHRRIVRRNLKFAFPEWTWNQVHRVARKVFQHFGITVLEIFQISCSSLEEVLAKAHRIEGIEHLNRLQNGALLISAHLGNWEISAQYVSAMGKAPFVAVARKIRFKPFERWLNRLRTRFGGELIDKKGALPKMREALRQGKILGVLIDQGGEAATAKFFGHDVQAHAAVALLAMRCQKPVIPSFCVREPNGFRIILEPPLVLQRTNDLRADIESNIQLMMDAVEQAIRSYPDQWFWLHKRWKKFYPQLYREELEKKRRKQNSIGRRERSKPS